MNHRLLISTLFLAVFCTSVLQATGFDECHAEFSAYVGARPYIVNPSVEERARTGIVTVFDYPAASSEGRVSWRLVIRAASTGEEVRSISGRSALAPGQQAAVETAWDGRDAEGAAVADGEYEIEAVAVFAPSRPGPGISPDEAISSSERVYATSSPVRVVIDREGAFDALFDPDALLQRRFEHAAASLDGTFAWDFYFGTNHAHTSWSDGGMPVTDCTSGKYGYVGGAVPSDAFSYARTTGEVDFIGVVEHNHLMQEACSGCTASEVLNRYIAGFDAAQAATVPGSFVGLWGMEWGVISGGGHVNIYNQSNLMSWAGEPFHVETPKSDYVALYSAMAANQGALGSFGTFNHPQTSDFGNWERTSAGDSVMRGLSVISGPAFSTSTSFEPGGTTYGARYDQALSYGWKVAPESHQDNHCWNYGNSTPNRTVALIASGTQFEQSSLLEAMNARRIYAAQDRDVQLRWGTSDGARVMGDSFSAASGVTVKAAVSDPVGEGVQKIEIRGGRAGTVADPGAAPIVVASNTASSSLEVQLAPQTAGEEWYYYVVAVQADGDTIWSAPMWIGWTSGGGGSDTTPPTVSITSPTDGSTVSGTVTVVAGASDDVGVSKVEFRLDNQLTATSLAAPFEWSWNTSTASNGAHSLTATAYDAAGNSTTSAAVNVTVSNESSGTGTDISGWVLTQANASYTFSLPAGTVIPAGGYVVIARSADQASFETFWGTALGADVIFIDSAGKMPVINGDETYQLSDAAGSILEGPTIAMGSSAGQSIQRADLCGAAGAATSWNVVATSSATPGSGAPAGCGASVRIGEFSDATGTGNYIYEFVELYNDANAGDTTPPTVSVLSPANGATVSGQVTVSIDATDDVGVSSVEVLLDGAVAATLTAAPYDWIWDTTTVVNGTHQVAARAYDDAGNSQLSTAHDVTVDNDSTPPEVSITSPAEGSSVSGVVIVAASASDASGVSSVELWVDGALHSSDTTAPYEWSWDTTTLADGAHSLTATAWDTKGNSATSAAVNVTVSNQAPIAGIDLSGWTITQANATYQFAIPAGTVVPDGGYVVIARDADQASFEAFWGPLAADVVFINSVGKMPVINGDETYQLNDGSGLLVEGPTIAMSSSAGQSIQRIDLCGAAGAAASWQVVTSGSANPGSGAPAGCGASVRILEFADATGTGNFVYEFIELYNDASATGDTTAPTVTITSPAGGSVLAGQVLVSIDATDDVGVTAVDVLIDGATVATLTAAPWEWTWDTTSATNGSHALEAHATDAAGNTGTSATVNVTVDNPTGTDISGWHLTQSNASLTWYLPAGTAIPSSGYVVIGRNATREAFESFWGVLLPSNVVYINSADAIPQINGSESYTLYNGNTKIDGATVSMSSGGGESLQRTRPCTAANKANAWNRVSSSSANPGSGAPASCGKGVYISEFSDALGTGNWVYEFVELHNDL